MTNANIRHHLTMSRQWRRDEQRLRSKVPENRKEWFYMVAELMDYRAKRFWHLAQAMSWREQSSTRAQPPV